MTYVKDTTVRLLREQLQKADCRSEKYARALRQIADHAVDAANARRIALEALK